MKTLVKKVSHTELPKEALEAISERQRSYIDEFVFYEYNTSKGIEYVCFYADELLCVWQNGHWDSILTSNSILFNHLRGT